MNPETNRIEYKQQLTEDLEKEAIAFLNYHEGVKKTLNQQFASNLELLTEDGLYNYVAYLLADVNGMSIKVAKYDGLDRVDLMENNEYGYCSLIKATKQVQDKIDVENKTFAKITSKERKEKRLWNSVALREAIINAIVYNDYLRKYRLSLSYLMIEQKLLHLAACHKA